MKELSLPINERFEQAIVFRAARWLPLMLGGLAIIALIVTSGMAIYSLRPTPDVTKPPLVPKPTPVLVKLADLNQSTAKVDKPDSSSGVASDESKLVVDPLSAAERKSALEFVAELARFRALVLERGLAFTDVIGKKCTFAYAGTCYRQEDVVKKPGVASKVLDVLKIYEVDPDAKRVEFIIPDSDLTIKLLVDPSLDTRTGVIKELTGLLTRGGAADTGRYIHNWVQVRTERELAQRAEYAAKLEQQEMHHSMAVKAQAEAVVEKKAMRSTMLLGIGAALFILLFSGLALAIIAIERHARAIQSLVHKMPFTRMNAEIASQ